MPRSGKLAHSDRWRLLLGAALPAAAQVGEIGKLIDWAQSTSPLPPTLGGRTSPAGYSSLLGYGRSVCVCRRGGGAWYRSAMHAYGPCPAWPCRGTAGACRRLPPVCVCCHHAMPQPRRPCCRLSFGGGDKSPVISPLGDASNRMHGSLGGRAGPSPKPQVHVASPSGRSPAPSPSKVR